MKRLTVFLSILLICLAFISCTQELDLEDYVIVIPQNADINVRYASQNLALMIEEKTGLTIPIVTDNEGERDKEILIGDTSRAQSATGALGKGEYLLFKKDDKIVIKGDGIYVGASCGDFINRYLDFGKNAQAPICTLEDEEKILTYEAPTTYKSVIFMIGDGMGENHITMTELCTGNAFVAKQFYAIGKSVTRSQSVIDGLASATDSSASATAMSTGYKTLNEHVGVDKDGQILKNVRELARENGAKTAVITTDVITGGTPSAYLCHGISRDETDTLQSQIDALVANAEIDYIAGDVGDALTDKTREALWQISRDGSAFFALIEEGQIDKASHDKDEESAIEYVARFNDAIAYATQFALCHTEVALIVTADHETGNLKKINGAPCGYYFTSYGHTNLDTPIFALGASSAQFNGTRVENIALAKYCALAYTAEPFGQSDIIE